MTTYYKKVGASNMGMVDQIKQPLQQMLQWFAPLCCAGCGVENANPCPSCLAELQVIAGAGCQRCHNPAVHEDCLSCDWCQAIKHFPDRIISIYNYRGLAQKLLQEAKFESVYGHYHSMLSPLPPQVWQVLPLFEYDAFVPIPATYRRRIQRMANSADVIAQTLSHSTSVPVNTQLRCRHFSHQPQVGLTQEARRKNVKDRFTWKAKGKLPQAVILVDDVLTTGATLEEATKVLRLAGVERIAWFTLMRTP